jgi:Kef-type K+ transport system membrane component KefB
VKSSELLRVGGTALLVATLGVIVPFLAGWAILSIAGAPRIEAIFVGAAMMATSVGITAQVLSVRGLLTNVASRIILAAAVIDDVLGLLVLAVVSSMAKGQINVAELLLTALAAGGFTFVVAKWGTNAMSLIIPRVNARLRAEESRFNLAMVLLFFLSLLATFAGVAAIIGAFLAGMALAESTDERMNNLVQGVTELLMPFFLVGLGMRMDLHGFSDPRAIALTTVIVLAAVASKLVGCGLGALKLGWNGAVRVGVGMVPRGEVGMVVAQIGFGLGVIGKQVYSDVVLMAVATTLIAPPLIGMAFRNVTPTPAVEEFKLL